MRRGVPYAVSALLAQWINQGLAGWNSSKLSRGKASTTCCTRALRPASAATSVGTQRSVGNQNRPLGVSINQIRQLQGMRWLVLLALGVLGAQLVVWAAFSVTPGSSADCLPPLTASRTLRCSA